MLNPMFSLISTLYFTSMEYILGTPISIKSFNFDSCVHCLIKVHTHFLSEPWKHSQGH